METLSQLCFAFQRLYCYYFNMNAGIGRLISFFLALPCHASSLRGMAAEARRLIPSRRMRSGQATVEYAVVAGILTATVAILAVFLYTFREYGGRVLDMVSSEYP